MKHEYFEKTTYSEIDPRELVRLCLDHDRRAWNELFRRYTSLLRKNIKATLQKNGYQVRDQEDEAIDKIYTDLVIKLNKDEILKQCTNPDGVEYWLKDIARNETIDWFRERNRLKNLPRTDAEGAALSLDAPLHRESDVTLGETLSLEKYDNDMAAEKLGRVLQCMEGEERKLSYWVLRLCVLAQDPLTPEELAFLESFCCQDPDDICRQLEAMQADIDEQTEKRIKAEARAVTLWHKLRKLEKRLVDPFARLSESDRKELAEDMANTERLREEHLLQSRILCRPTNAAIAKLLGLPEEKVNQISVILKRAREGLRKRL